MRACVTCGVAGLRVDRAVRPPPCACASSQPAAPDCLARHLLAHTCTCMRPLNCEPCAACGPPRCYPLPPPPPSTLLPPHVPAAQLADPCDISAFATCRPPDVPDRAAAALALLFAHRIDKVPRPAPRLRIGHTDAWPRTRRATRVALGKPRGASLLSRRGWRGPRHRLPSR